MSAQPRRACPSVGRAIIKDIGELLERSSGVLLTGSEGAGLGRFGPGEAHAQAAADGCKDVKPEARVLGVDDGPFTWGDPSTPVVGVVMRGGAYVEAVLRTHVTVDGDDANSQLVDMIASSRYREQLQCILLDGVCLGGFNVVDLDALNEAFAIPVVTVTRDAPDKDAIEAALRKHFPDAERRIALLERHELHRVATAHNPVWVKAVGMPIEEAAQLVRSTTVRGAIPEPLRLAHLIAAAFKNGESRGRA
jgi:hypothetical protein